MRTRRGIPQRSRTLRDLAAEAERSSNEKSDALILLKPAYSGEEIDDEVASHVASEGVPCLHFRLRGGRPRRVSERSQRFPRSTWVEQRLTVHMRPLPISNGITAGGGLAAVGDMTTPGRLAHLAGLRLGAFPGRSWPLMVTKAGGTSRRHVRRLLSRRQQRSPRAPQPLERCCRHRVVRPLQPEGDKAVAPCSNKGPLA